MPNPSASSYSSCFLLLPLNSALQSDGLRSVRLVAHGNGSPSQVPTVWPNQRSPINDSALSLENTPLLPRFPKALYAGMGSGVVSHMAFALPSLLFRSCPAHLQSFPGIPVRC